VVNSAWFRLAGSLDIEGWVDESETTARRLESFVGLEVVP
jgi:hypothetical protein